MGDINRIWMEIMGKKDNKNQHSNINQYQVYDTITYQISSIWNINIKYIWHKYW